MSDVVLIDSGVKIAHPHLVGMGDVVCGPTFHGDGRRTEGEQVDRLAHGTPAAALILLAAPGIRLCSIKVFDEVMECPFERVLDAIDAALEQEPRLVNLSLGTTSISWVDALETRVERAAEAGVRLVAPASYQGLPSYPGSLSGVDGVIADPSIEGDPVLDRSSSRPWWRASPFSRDVPGIPRERNRQGASFAVARVTGWLARG